MFQKPYPANNYSNLYQDFARPIVYFEKYYFGMRLLYRIMRAGEPNMKPAYSVECMPYFEPFEHKAYYLRFAAEYMKSAPFDIRAAAYCYNMASAHFAPVVDKRDNLPSFDNFDTVLGKVPDKALDTVFDKDYIEPPDWNLLFGVDFERFHKIRGST